MGGHGLKPHLTKTFKLSNDKQFVEKVKDIVGLYLDPPDRALVLSVDEKSQIQAPIDSPVVFRNDGALIYPRSANG